MFNKFLSYVSIPYSPFVGFIAMIGCAIRIVNDFKRGTTNKVSLIITDLLISIFTGYISFWILIENTDFNLSICSFIVCMVGYLGSKIFDLFSFILYKKIGYTSKETKNDS